ncbi:MAG: PAS domain-containing protein [Janthinobacterium lividum]
MPPLLPRPMPQSRSARLASTAATCVAVAMLGASAWFTYANLAGIEATDALSGQVHRAQLATETLLSTIEDAETGQRGFLLTQNPAYLETYDAARRRLGSDFTRLEKAPLLDGARTVAIGRMRELAAAKLAELGQTVELGRAGQTGAALDIVQTNRGKVIMDALRAEADILQAQAENALAYAHAQSRSGWVWTEPLGLAVLASILLAAVAMQQRRVGRAIAANFVRLERFTRAFGLAPGMLRATDGRITFWGEGAERLYGYPAAAALGRISYDLLRTKFPVPLTEIEAALSRDGQWQGELVHRRQDGAELVVASHWALHPGEAGEADSIIELLTDITALKRTAAELEFRELKLRLALNASDLGTWRWDVLDERNGLVLDPRCKALFGFERDASVSHADWMTAIPPDDRARTLAEMARALDPANPDDGYVGEHRAVHANGRVLWLASAGRAAFEPDRTVAAGRRAVRIMGTIRDVTAVREAEQERQQAAALVRTIMETAPGLIYAKDRNGRMLLANAPVLDLIGKPWAEVEGRPDLEYLDDPAQAEALMANDRRIMETGKIEELEELIGSEGAQPRVWLSTKTPLRDADDQVTGLVGVSVEITERKRAEERLRLVIHELNHRVKNTLTTVQAIASQTFRGIDAGVRHAFEARLIALSSAHDVLTREAWLGAELADVVAGALTPHGWPDPARFRVSGPPMRLQPRAAVALAMGLHELATNALKYGALSTREGEVEIWWGIGGNDTPRFRLTWNERGGPTATTPLRRGFGTKLVERSLAQDLGGTARITYATEGITCAVEAPLAEVAAAAEVVPFLRVGSSGGH